MKKLLLALTLAALTLPSIAAAKEIKSLSVCGTSGCVTASSGDDRVRAMWAAFESGGPQGPGGLPIEQAVVPAREYYKLRIGIGGGNDAKVVSEDLWYVKPDLMKWAEHEDGPLQPFHRLSPVGAALVQELARDVKPFPTPRVLGANVDDRLVAEPAKLIELFAGERADDAAASAGETASLYLKPSRPNPWFSGGMQFIYLPETQVLMLSDPVHVGRDAASVIADTGGFPQPPGGGMSWTRPLAIGLPAFALLAALLLVLARRRPRQRERARPTTA